MCFIIVHERKAVIIIFPNLCPFIVSIGKYDAAAIMKQALESRLGFKGFGASIKKQLFALRHGKSGLIIEMIIKYNFVVLHAIPPTHSLNFALSIAVHHHHGQIRSSRHIVTWLVLFFVDPFSVS